MIPDSYQFARSTPARRLFGFCTLGHYVARHPAEKGQRPHIRADPVRQALRPEPALRRRGSPRRRCSSTPPAQRRPPAPCATRRCCRPPPPPSARHSPPTAARRPGGPAAWSATGGSPSRGKARTSGCSRSRRCGWPGIPPKAAAAVTPGRRLVRVAAQPRWITVQSGSALCRMPGLEPPTAANSSASGPPSVSVVGSGQASPTAAARARQSCTVLRAGAGLRPNLRAREPDCAQICAHRHADARISVVKVLECSMYSIS